VQLSAQDVWADLTLVNPAIVKAFVTMISIVIVCPVLLPLNIGRNKDGRTTYHTV
jgi:hypothetical protein